MSAKGRFLLLPSLLVIASCTPSTATPTPPTSRFAPATNPPGHVATLVARATAWAADPTLVPTATTPPTWSPPPGYVAPTQRPTPTPSPSPTPTAITHRPAEPAPVVLGRAAIEGTTLSWFTPEQAARVVAVTYVSNVDFWEVVDALGGKAVMRGESTAIFTSIDRFKNSSKVAEDVLAMAEVDAGPPRRLAADDSYRPSWTAALRGHGVPLAGRRRITYLFNASTGVSLGSPSLGDVLDSFGADPGVKSRTVLATLHERPIQVVVITAPPPTRDPDHVGDMIRPAPSPLPTSATIPDLRGGLCLPDDARPTRLPPDAVPAALAETVRWLPYVEGATWTYELTRSRMEVEWLRSHRRVTVADRWRLAEDAMLVHLRAEHDRPLPQGPFDDETTPHRWIILLPGASYEVRGCGGNLAQRRKSLATADQVPGLDWVDAWDLLVEPRAKGSDSEVSEWRAETIQDAPAIWPSPVGPVQGCRLYGLPTRDANRARRAYLCPDVGWLAIAKEGSWGSQFATESAVLVDYHIPRWRVIP